MTRVDFCTAAPVHTDVKKFYSLPARALMRTYPHYGQRLPPLR